MNVILLIILVCKKSPQPPFFSIYSWISSIPVMGLSGGAHAAAEWAVLVLLAGLCLTRVLKHIYDKYFLRNSILLLALSMGEYQI